MPAQRLRRVRDPLERVTDPVGLPLLARFHHQRPDDVHPAAAVGLVHRQPGRGERDRVDEVGPAAVRVILRPRRVGGGLAVGIRDRGALVRGRVDPLDGLSDRPRPAVTQRQLLKAVGRCVVEFRDERQRDAEPGIALATGAVREPAQPFLAERHMP